MKKIAMLFIGLMLAASCAAGTRHPDGSATLTAEEVAFVEVNIEKLESENAEYERLIDEAAVLFMIMQMKIDALEKQQKAKSQCL